MIADLLAPMLTRVDSGRHRRMSATGQWQSVPVALRGNASGRHRRPIPNPFRRYAARALLAGATVTALTAVTAPAHAAPAETGPAAPDTPVTPDATAGLALAPDHTSFVPEAAAAVPDASSVLPDAEPVTEPGPPVPDWTQLTTLPADALTAIGSLGNFELPGLDLPALFHSDTAIVVLGYGLLPDGSMRPELDARLYAGYVSALLSPASPIIVTGGNPQNGVTEAQAMADWLIARGIAPERIHTETRANSTVQNATFSAQVMAAIGAHAAILITSADHIARALSNFRAAGVSVVATMTPDVAPLSAQPFGPGH